MRKIAAITFALLCWLINTANAGTLSAEEVSTLRAEIAAMLSAVDQGDSEALIERTHPSVWKLVGGKAAFEKLTRQAVAQLRQAGVKIVSTEIGIPTETYLAGDEEVCFVPRFSIMEMPGRRAKSTTFLIAIRRFGGREWSFLDSAGLRTNPQMLYQLLPELDRSIALPENTIEAL